MKTILAGVGLYVLGFVMGAGAIITLAAYEFVVAYRESQ